MPAAVRGSLASRRARRRIPACCASGLLALGVSVACPHPCAAQEPSRATPELPFPGELERPARVAGNPLATYAALLDLEADYRASPFAPIYDEIRLNYEEFLGLPSAGLEAMSLPPFRAQPSEGEEPIPAGYSATSALDAIARQARTTRIVIFGEEHHLPQTRSLHEALLRRLWDLGYRYLAAETFADVVMAADFGGPSYASGSYLMDPVYATALRTARDLGYRLVAYDTSAQGPPGDASFRDRTQAENLVQRIFARDPEARVLVLAGRGHAAEVPPPDGWTPMASVLKERTGIDPFTIYAPTMSARRTPQEEDPRYRFATSRGLVNEPTIFLDAEGRSLGSGNCDAFLFWPRPTLVSGRPDWMQKTLGRRASAIPAPLLDGHGLRLVQAFRDGEAPTLVPVDQVLLREGEPAPALMLPAGSFWIRVIDAQGRTSGPVALKL